MKYVAKVRFDRVTGPEGEPIAIQNLENYKAMVVSKGAVADAKLVTWTGDRLVELTFDDKHRILLSTDEFEEKFEEVK